MNVDGKKQAGSTTESKKKQETGSGSGKPSPSKLPVPVSPPHRTACGPVLESGPKNVSSPTGSNKENIAPDGTVSPSMLNNTTVPMLSAAHMDSPSTEPRQKKRCLVKEKESFGESCADALDAVYQEDNYFRADQPHYGAVLTAFLALFSF